jgi:hypothetical protein
MFNSFFLIDAKSPQKLHPTTKIPIFYLKADVMYFLGSRAGFRHSLFVYMLRHALKGAQTMALSLLLILCLKFNNISQTHIPDF